MNSNHRLSKAARRLALTALAIPFILPSPAAATDQDSFCGRRSDFGRTARLTIIGLTAEQGLVKFNECRPGKLKQIGAVSGLQDLDKALVGIDFRVQDGELYGVGDGGADVALAPVNRPNSGKQVLVDGVFEQVTARSGTQDLANVHGILVHAQR